MKTNKESLEMAIKALLRSMAIEYPKGHDVGDSLIYIEKKLPDYLRS